MTMIRRLLVFLLLSVFLLIFNADGHRFRRYKREINNDQDHDELTDNDELTEIHQVRRRHQHQTHHRHDNEGETLEQPNATVYTPVRHHDPSQEGIPVGEALGALKCPPPITPFYSELCIASACLHHHHCPPSTACCFNGCVHTCLSQVDSPSVIDWLEDTSAVLPILEESAPPTLPIRYEETNLEFAEGGGEAVHLPGGCTISGTQYSQLQDFMKAPSIDDCRCSQGEVVCAVR